jgi:hypothetical protein
MVENVNDLIGKLRDSDVYSIMCSLLYDLHEVPEYSIISELCYLTDVESFENIVQYMAGRTIKIPTKEEFADAIQVLRLFQYAEVEKRPWKDAVVMAGYRTGSGKLAKNKLEKLKATLAKTKIGNRDY